MLPRVGGRTLRSVHPHHLPPELREAVREARGGEHDPRAGVRQHEGQPVGGVRGVQGEVDAPGPEHGQERDHGVDPALQCDADAGLRAHAAPSQLPREPAGAAVQLRVGEHGPAVHDRRRVRGAPRLRLEPPVQGPLGAGSRSPAPPLQHPPPLRPVQERHLPEVRLRVRQERLQERVVVADHPLHGAPVEQVGGVLPHRVHLVLRRAGAHLRPRHDHHVQVELRRPVVQRLHHLHREAGEVQLRVGGVVRPEADLVDGEPAQAALRLDRLHHLPEVHVLVRVRLPGGVLHPRHQLPEAAHPAQPRPDRHGVDDHPDERLRCLPAPVRHGAAQAEVLLPRVALHQRLEAGEQRHVERGPAPAPEVARGPRDARGDAGAHRAPAEAHGGRARTVGGELQRGVRPGERLLPVLQVGARPLPAHHLPVPRREVGELDRQLRERGRRPAREGGVERGQLAEEDAERPPVVHQVVLHVHQPVLAPGEPDQRPAHQREGRQVEAAPEVAAHPRLHGSFPLPRRKAGEVDAGEADRPGRVDALHGPGVHGGEGGAEDLVAPDDLRERGVQRGDVQLASEDERRLRVVGEVVGGELRQEPDLLLRERHREVAPAREREERRESGCGALRAGGFERARHLRHGAAAQHGGERHLHAEPLAEAGDHLRGRERVAAQLGEVVLRADPGDPQHLLPDGRHLPLGPGPRRDVRRGERRPGGGGRGERGAVQLPVGGQRERRQRHEGGGDHVLRERPPQEAAQLARGGERLAPPHHQVRHQVEPPGAVFARRHGRVRERGVGGEGRGHLAGLDAVAAHLDLLVHAPHELQRPAGEEPHPVAGAVQPRARFSGIRVGEEALRRELRPPQVAARHPLPAHEQLALARGLHRPVQDVDLRAGDGRADRRGAAVRRALRGGGADGRLGGSVRVHEAPPRRPAPHQLRGARLPRDDQRPERGELRLREEGQHGGGEDGVGDPALRQEPRQPRPGEERLAGGQVQLRPGRERDGGLAHGCVEAGGGELEEAVPGAHPEEPAEGERGVAQPPVGDADALGAPRGAGGVDDVGQAVGGDGGLGRVRDAPLPCPSPAGGGGENCVESDQVAVEGREVVHEARRWSGRSARRSPPACTPAGRRGTPGRAGRRRPPPSRRPASRRPSPASAPGRSPPASPPPPRARAGAVRAARPAGPAPRTSAAPPRPRRPPRPAPARPAARRGGGRTPGPRRSFHSQRSWKAYLSKRCRTVGMRGWRSDAREDRKASRVCLYFAPRIDTYPIGRLYLRDPREGCEPEGARPARLFARVSTPLASVVCWLTEPQPDPAPAGARPSPRRSSSKTPPSSEEPACRRTRWRTGRRSSSACWRRRGSRSRPSPTSRAGRGAARCPPRSRSGGSGSWTGWSRGAPPTTSPARRSWRDRWTRPRSPAPCAPWPTATRRCGRRSRRPGASRCRWWPRPDARCCGRWSWVGWRPRSGSGRRWRRRGGWRASPSTSSGGRSSARRSCAWRGTATSSSWKPTTW